MASDTAVPVVAYRFVADTADALRKNNELHDSIERVGKVKFLDLDVSVTKLAGAFRGLIPVVTAVEIFNFAKGAVAAADALGDAAARADLSASAFSRLQYIATESDVEFSELTSALKQYRLGLADAENGTGSARDALKRLNLTAAELTSMSIEDQLALIADRFADVSSTEDRARISADLFKKAGQAMIPLLDQGSEKLRELATDADKFGQVLDDRAAQGIDKLTKALTRLKTAAQLSIANTVGNAVADTFGTGDELKDTEAKLANLYQRKLDISRSPSMFGEVGRAELSTVNREIQEVTRALDELKIKMGATTLSDNLPFDRWRNELIDDVVIQPVSITAQKIPEKDPWANWREEQAQQRAAAEEAFEYELGQRVASVRDEANKKVTDDLEKELKKRHDLEDGFRDQARQREEWLQETLTDFRANGVAAATTLLTAYGGKYKAFAKAILVVEKAHAIARTIISTKAAAAAALEYYGPTPVGYAAAAAAIAYGVAQVAAIASTVIGGGSASDAGSPHNPVYTAPSASSDSNASSLQGTPAPAETRALSVVVNGNIYSGKETVDFLFNELRQRINEYDSVLISPTSRQARELIPEATA